MSSYLEIRDYFASKDCKLLTTLDEFVENKMGCNSNFRIIGACGCEKMCWLRNLKYNGNGHVCRYCATGQQKFSYQIAKNFFESKGCQLLTTHDGYLDNKMNSNSDYRIIGLCGHEKMCRYDNLKFQDKGAICGLCARKAVEDRVIYDRYDEICQKLSEKGCQLSMTCDEFVAAGMSKISKLPILSKCGHENIITFNHIDQYDCGVYCKVCSKMNTRINSSSTYDYVENTSSSAIIERDGVQIIRSKIRGRFDVKKLKEGTRADIVVRPIEVVDDMWLPIQVKTTAKFNEKYKYYRFSSRKVYENMIICCISLADTKIWVFDDKYKLNKTITIYDGPKCKYKNNLVSNLLEHMIKLYHQCKNVLIQFLNIDVPTSKTLLVEMYWRNFREQKLSFLNFRYPDIDGCVTDFYINNFKIQEKTALFSQAARTWYVSLSKTKGTYRDKNGKKRRNVVNYDRGDNDFYWLNVKDNNTFYIIPEHDLCQKRYINERSDKKLHQRFNLYPNNYYSDDKWTNSYRFRYDDLNVDKLKSLFYV